MGHVKFESNVYIEEKDYLNNFEKIGYTVLQSKNGCVRFFGNRTYDSDIIYCVVKKAGDEQFGNVTDYMLKLVDLGTSLKSKGGVFEMPSNNEGRLETLHWSYLFRVYLYRVIIILL